MKRLLTVIGIVFALAGLVVAGTDLHASERGDTVRCGAAFDDLGHGDALSTDSHNEMAHAFSGYQSETDFVDKCESKKTIFKVLAIVLGIIGIALIVGSFVVPNPARETT